MNKDLEHLKLLSIFHYVSAGLLAMFACVYLINVAMGIAMVTKVFDQSGEGVPPFLGWMLIIMGSVGVVGGWVAACLAFAAGRCLARRQRRVFCLVVAGIDCLFMPVGTVLGIFTIIVLSRPSMKPLFDGAAPVAVPGSP